MIRALGKSGGQADLRAGVRAIVLDIEGTTTPLAFVYEVLFPYARRRLRAYLSDSIHSEALAEPLQRLREEWLVERAEEPSAGAPPRLNPDTSDSSPFGHAAEALDLEWALTYAEWLMDRDRKSPGLKQLQGLIWKEGYHSGELQGEVFSDVAPALALWRMARVDIAIYSSGSVLAQRLLFGSTAEGDLTPLITRFFDTDIGAKQSTDSYRRIATELACPPSQVLFISDVTSELDAAHAAGCQVILSVRPGNRPQPAHDYRVIDTFRDLQTV